MMKSTIIYPVFAGMLILFLVSCNGTGGKHVLSVFKNVDPETYESDVKDLAVSSESKPTVVSVKNAAEKEDMLQSVLYDTITFVRLSNEPEALIGVIDKIVFNDSSIYILDRYKTKSIKKFSLNGDFISAIGSRGQGPDEYIEPTDFNVCGDEILVYDQFKSDIKYYDLDGNLKYRKKLPFLFMRFARFSPNQYIFHGVNADNDHLQSIVNYSIFESDSAFVLNRRGFYRLKDLYVSFVDDNFYFTKNKLFYHPVGSDTIFSVNKDNFINVEYVFDFQGKKSLPLKYYLQKNSRESLKILDTDQYIDFSGAFIPTDDYLYFQYSIKHLVYKGVYSSRTKKTIKYSTIGNNINPLPCSNILTSIGNNTLVGYTQTTGIEKFFKENPREMLVKLYGENIIKSLETAEDEDNPIILFLKIKDF